MGQSGLRSLPPEQIVLLSMLFAILIGTFFLSLPIATKQALSFIDILFTATSATCVTGLFTIPLESFTLFGHAIIMVLMQIGGLGLITLTLFFLFMFANLGLGAKFMAGHILEVDSFKNIKRLLFFIFKITLAAELIGALCMLPAFLQNYPIGQATFLALFHAISSFCNAGISTLPGGLEAVKTSYPILLSCTGLMFIGGLGFITWYEIVNWIKDSYHRKRHHFSLHSKIVLYGSTALIVSSGILFWILEHDNIFAQLSVSDIFINCLFYAVSFKSTGFLALPLVQLQVASLFLILVISFIGSAPGSTGSGIKITTLSIFVATVKAAISGRTTVELRGRTIPQDLVYKSIAIITVSILFIFLTTFCLLITEKGWTFFDLLFEASAAFTTLGITTGVTQSLSFIGKYLIILCMIVGRIGSFTLILALKLKKKKDIVAFKYPEERVMLG